MQGPKKPNSSLRLRPSPSSKGEKKRKRDGSPPISPTLVLQKGGNRPDRLQWICTLPKQLSTGNPLSLFLRGERGKRGLRPPQKEVCKNYKRSGQGPTPPPSYWEGGGTGLVLDAKESEKRHSCMLCSVSWTSNFHCRTTRGGDSRMGGGMSDSPEQGLTNGPSRSYYSSQKKKGRIHGGGWLRFFQGEEEISARLSWVEVLFTN